MSQALDGFERELTLKELLRGIDVGRLSAALQTLIHAQVSIVDDQETLLFGEMPTPDAPRRALVGELEAVGYISANTDQTLLEAAANVAMTVLRANARYLMASDLHIQTQRADFEELERRHAALEISEQRYKALAESLELRVKEQVKTIEKAQIKVYENEKLASVGRLAAGVAHEINNPIGFIQSNLNTVASYQESLEKIGSLIESGANTDAIQAAWKREDMNFVQQDMKDILNECISGTSRISAIVKDLKGFSRVDQASYEAANINDILRQVCHVAAAEVRNKAEIIMDLGELPMLKCHPGQLGQVFLGLLINAADAFSQPGKILIRSRLNEKQIAIDVRDNGCGMPESVLKHIFDPFFTTKEVGKGMGLGLTVCLDIVKSHGGTLEIKSRPGKGTLVSIVLPLKSGN